MKFNVLLTNNIISSCFLFSVRFIEYLPNTVKLKDALNSHAKYKSLTLKVPNKNCSRQHFIFLLLSF